MNNINVNTMLSLKQRQLIIANINALNALGENYDKLTIEEFIALIDGLKKTNSLTIDYTNDLFDPRRWDKFDILDLILGPEIINGTVAPFMGIAKLVVKYITNTMIWA